MNAVTHLRMIKKPLATNVSNRKFFIHCSWFSKLRCAKLITLSHSLAFGSLWFLLFRCSRHPPSSIQAGKKLGDVDAVAVVIGWMLLLDESRNARGSKTWQGTERNGTGRKKKLLECEQFYLTLISCCKRKTRKKPNSTWLIRFAKHKQKINGIYSFT